MGFAGKKVPPVSDADMGEAKEFEQEITGFAAHSKPGWLFLKLAFRKGDMATGYIDPIRAQYFFDVLKRLLPNGGENDGSPVNWAKGVQIDESHGHFFPKR